MKIKKFEFDSFETTTLPPADGQKWNRQWHGYFQMAKVRSALKSERDQKAHALSEPQADDVMGEGEFEAQLFLGILTDCPKQHITMIEAGAGRGDWCLSLAGVVDHRFPGVDAKTYHCIAVEGEPDHFRWTQEHFLKQGIKGDAVWAAVSNYNGYCWFQTEQNPADAYGQSMSDEGEEEVPCITIREIMRQHDMSVVDILHMDIQGAELDVLMDSFDLFSQGKIRYMLLGTHGKELHENIREFLAEYMDFSIDLLPQSGVVSTPIGKTNISVDGILMGKSKVDIPTEERQDRLTDSSSAPEKPHTFMPPADRNMSFSQLEKSCIKRMKDGQYLEAVRYIRRWTAQKASITTLEFCNTTIQGYLPNHLAGYANFSQGSICGGTANLLTALYAYFGFPAACVNFGIDTGGIGLTHVVSWVSIPGTKRETVLVQDAYLNAEYGIDGQHPTDVRTCLATLPTDRERLTLVDHHPSDSRAWVERDKNGSLEGIHTVQMFSSSGWFNDSTKKDGRDYLNKALNLENDEATAFDLMLFPKNTRIRKDSSGLIQAVDFYQQLTGFLNQSISKHGYVDSATMKQLEANPVFQMWKNPKAE